MTAEAILVTGAAGFGSHIARRLVEQPSSASTTSNAYYESMSRMYRSPNSPVANRSTSCKLAPEDRNDVVAPFAEGKSTSRGAFRRPGRRASHNTPHGNINSNIAGFLNVPESCRHAGKWS